MIESATTSNKIDDWVIWTDSSTAPQFQTKSDPRISKHQASSILAPEDYCDLEFREASKITLQGFICNPSGSGNVYK